MTARYWHCTCALFFPGDTVPNVLVCRQEQAHEEHCEEVQSIQLGYNLLAMGRVVAGGREHRQRFIEHAQGAFNFLEPLMYYRTNYITPFHCTSGQCCELWPHVGGHWAFRWVKLISEWELPPPSQIWGVNMSSWRKWIREQKTTQRVVDCTKNAAEDLWWVHWM